MTFTYRCVFDILLHTSELQMNYGIEKYSNFGFSATVPMTVTMVKVKLN